MPEGSLALYCRQQAPILHDSSFRSARCRRATASGGQSGDARFPSSLSVSHGPHFLEEDIERTYGIPGQELLDLLSGVLTMAHMSYDFYFGLMRASMFSLE